MNIYVGNLNFTLNENELKRIFIEYGEITSIKIITDPETGLGKGFGFINMENETEAKVAIEELNGTTVKGKVIRVSKAAQKKY